MEGLREERNSSGTFLSSNVSLLGGLTRVSKLSAADCRDLGIWWGGIDGSACRSGLD